MEKFLNKRLALGSGTLLGLALLVVGLTILFNYALRGWRVDLTQSHMYTLAPGTVRILKNINEPVNLYFFYSEKAASDNRLQDIKNYGVHVRELLEDLASRSHGKIRLHEIDPAPFSEDEDRAAELGVQGNQLGAAGGQLYFGLAGTNSTDGHAPPIAFFDPRKEQFLEYDVVKLIYQLANPKKPVIGWLSSLPMTQGFDQRTGQVRDPWVIYQQAEQLYEVKPVEPGATQIDPSISVLVLVHPKNLSPATQFAIDQYALNGGHVLAFVDPVAESDTAGADPNNPMAAMAADKSSQLGALLTAWGVQFDPKQVVADRAHALTLSTRQGPEVHFGYLGLDKTTFDAADVVTAGLSSINVATAGFLTPVKDAKTKFEPLLETSTDAEPMPASRFQMLFDPASLRDGYKPTGQRYTIAARVTGAVKTAFPGGAPSGVTLPPGTTPLKESKGPLNLVVFADTDLLQDFLWVREQNFFGQRVAQALASNGDLVLNALDNLAGSSDLISVRGRATFSRPFTRVEALQRQADDRFRATEQQLEKELRDTEDKLTQLQSKRSDKSSVILTPEQTRELDGFQARKLEIRKQLRSVRAGLDSDIKGLGNWIKFINIILIPVIFAIAALLTFLWRRSQRSAGAVPAPKVQEAKS